MLKYNKYKELKLMVFASALFTGITSCEDLVDEVPISEIAPESFYSTNEDLEAALISVYDGMQTAYREDTFYWGEFRSDNHIAVSGTNNIEINENVISPGNGAANWEDLYRTISRANDVIANAPSVVGFNEDFYAEALAVRAKAYFDAIRVWGDVPLFTEPVRSYDDAFKPATSSETIINELIVPDMLKAQEMMSIASSDFRFSKASIYALQAEVYMWLGEHGNAKIAIENLIALGKYQLVNTPEAWQDLFYNDRPTDSQPENRGKVQEGTELILSIRYELTDGTSASQRSGIAQLFRGGTPKFYMSSEVETKWQDRFPIDEVMWTEKYPNTDPALTRTVFVDDGTGELVEQEEPVYGDWRYYYSRQGGVSGFGTYPIGEAKTGKWGEQVYASNDDDTDIVIYRYADMLLLLAEAESYLEPAGTNALAIINELRAARKLPSVSTTEFGATQEERLGFILDERQFELFGEGKRWWDLVRNNKAISTMTPILDEKGVTTPLTESRLIWPINSEHLLENTLLEQNSGYLN